MKLNLKVIPNSSRNMIVGWVGDSLKVKIAAPPEKGKANKELVKFLAKSFEVSKSEISIISGYKDRSKVIEVFGELMNIPEKPMKLL